MSQKTREQRGQRCVRSCSALQLVSVIAYAWSHRVWRSPTLRGVVCPFSRTTNFADSRAVMIASLSFVLASPLVCVYGCHVRRKTRGRPCFPFCLRLPRQPENPGASMLPPRCVYGCHVSRKTRGRPFGSYTLWRGPFDRITSLRFPRLAAYQPRPAPGSV